MGFIDEEDMEFTEFMENLDFMDLAAEVLGDLFMMSGNKKPKNKKVT